MASQRQPRANDQPRRRRSREAKVAIVLTVLLHALLGGWLLFEQWTPPKKIAERTGRRSGVVRLALPPPSEFTPSPDIQTPTPFMITEEWVGSPEPVPTPPTAHVIEMADVERYDPPTPTPTPTPIATPKPLTDSQKRLLEFDAKAELKEREMIQDYQRLSQARAGWAIERTRGRDLGHVANNGDHTVVRHLEFRGVPEDILSRVLEKNGIDILYMHLDKSTKTNSPIGSASTDGGEYYAQPALKPGFYEVINISPKTEARIAALEDEYLRSRQLDPLKTMMIMVKYGIANMGNTRGWELVILEAKYQRVDGG